MLSLCVELVNLKKPKCKFFHGSSPALIKEGNARGMGALGDGVLSY